MHQSGNASPASADQTKVPLPTPSYQLSLEDLYFVASKKMKLILVLSVGLAFLGVVGACLFRNPTLFMYPLHASCNVTWTFQLGCEQVKEKLTHQMDLWKDDTTCGTGQKCLYTLGEVKENQIFATHTSRIRGRNQYMDEMNFTFYRNSATSGCNVIGYSTSRLYISLLDFGTNYCNLNNLMRGSGLTSDPHYSELTRDEICTQYTSADCEKY